MNKLFSLILFLMIILLTACQTNEIAFVGEGENWSAEVTVNQTDGDEKYRIQLTYKGNDIEKIETFSYDVESGNNGIIAFGANDASLNEEGKYQNKALSSNSPSTSIKDELVLNVEWNDNKESFMLRSK